MTSARVWSLWDMLKPFRNHQIFSALSYLSSTQRRLFDSLNRMAEDATINLHPEEIADIPKSISQLYQAGEDFDIPGVSSAADQAFEIFKSRAAAPRPSPEAPFSEARSMSRSDVNQLSHGLIGLQLTFLNVIKDTMLLSVSRDSVRYYSGDRLGFGQETEAAFPSSTNDAREASRCRALERWTACVMHCMRALEPALLALAEDVLGQAPKKQNWNEVLKEIKTKIDARKEAGEKHAALQFESEAAGYFRDIKDGWRNHTMHAHLWFGEDEAVAAYDATRSLMRHLSKRFSEAS